MEADEGAGGSDPLDHAPFQVEGAHLDEEPCGGFSGDLIKCYDEMPPEAIERMEKTSISRLGICPYACMVTHAVWERR